MCVVRVTCDALDLNVVFRDFRCDTQQTRIHIFYLQAKPDIADYLFIFFLKPRWLYRQMKAEVVFFHIDFCCTDQRNVQSVFFFEIATCAPYIAKRNHVYELTTCAPGSAKRNHVYVCKLHLTFVPGSRFRRRAVL